MRISTPSRHGVHVLALAEAAACAIVLLFVASIVLRPWPDALFGTDLCAFRTDGSLVREGEGPVLFDMDTQWRRSISSR